MEGVKGLLAYEQGIGGFVGPLAHGGGQAKGLWGLGGRVKGWPHV